jgi:hypothetical protein
MQMTSAAPAKLEALVYVDSAYTPPRTVNYAYIGGNTEEEIKQKINALVAEGCDGVRALTWAEYEAVDLAESMVRYNVNQATIIDAETFNDRLNVLPPCRWNAGYDFESFYVSECITGNIYSFYVRIKMGENHYFEVNADRGITDSELSKICLEALSASKAAD